jgi:outer membrane phospholipase A
VIASASPRASAGARFEIVVVPPAGVGAPDELVVRIRADIAEVDLAMQATGPALGGRRSYAATMPAFADGPTSVQLAEQASNVLVVLVARSDAVDMLAGHIGSRSVEPPLSENDPMYFIVGTRGGTTARFQISIKYRLFDVSSGYGQDQPWLSGLYFGYTQNSLWDLSTESKAFRDTSYRPSVFWKWERAGERAFFDGARLGLEHESNGGQGELSRSINIAFVRPEWHWRLRDGGLFQFMPKLYVYLDKDENPDIDDYRGYADWRVRFDSGDRWVASAMLRLGTAGKGSFQFDLSRRTRDIKFGPVSGYLHLQFFTGYGEDIIDYNVRRKSQLRVGFAIVP